MKDLKNILQQAEMIFLEQGDLIRICIFGNEGDSNNQILHRLGTSINSLKRMLADEKIRIVKLINDDDCLHLTISREDAERLELEITE